MTSDVQLDQLIAVARSGDTSALGQLLEVYRAYLSILAKVQIDARLRGKVSESDIVQDTMMKAREGFAQFRGKTERELLVWLRRILASRLADIGRRYYSERRNIKLERSLDYSIEMSSALLDRGLISREPSPSESTRQRERSALLANALMELRNDYREVLVLHHLEGLSFPDIADRMGRSVPSVKNIWVRSMEKLRELLGASL